MNDYLFKLRMNDLERKVDDLTGILTRIESRMTNEEELWDNVDLTKNWKVSPRTLAEWRSKGFIAYTQVGGKIYYSKDDRERFLRENRVSSSVTKG